MIYVVRMEWKSKSGQHRSFEILEDIEAAENRADEFVDCLDEEGYEGNGWHTALVFEIEETLHVSEDGIISQASTTLGAGNEPIYKKCSADDQMLRVYEKEVVE